MNRCIESLSRCVLALVLLASLSTPSFAQVPPAPPPPTYTFDDTFLADHVNGKIPSYAEITKTISDAIARLGGSGNVSSLVVPGTSFGSN